MDALFKSDTSKTRKADTMDWFSGVTADKPEPVRAAASTSGARDRKDVMDMFSTALTKEPRRKVSTAGHTSSSNKYFSRNLCHHQSLHSMTNYSVARFAHVQSVCSGHISYNAAKIACTFTVAGE
jgi:hypothetical protein